MNRVLCFQGDSYLITLEHILAGRVVLRLCLKESTQDDETKEIFSVIVASCFLFELRKVPIGGATTRSTSVSYLGGWKGIYRHALISKISTRLLQACSKWAACNCTLQLLIKMQCGWDSDNCGEQRSLEPHCTIKLDFSKVCSPWSWHKCKSLSHNDVDSDSL